MDASSIIGSLGTALTAVGEFIRTNAILVLLYSAIAMIALRVMNRAADEFTTRGVQAAEFFRFAEKKR
jgi:hypothetical protein